MRISVICPTRLEANPWEPILDGSPGLYLDRALNTVRQQDCWGEHEWRIIVCVDPGRAKDVPARFTSDPIVTVVEGEAPGQAGALNEGIHASLTSDAIAIIEDDDLWHPAKMRVQLAEIDGADLVTCCQREVDESGSFLRVNYFATPSGWVFHSAPLAVDFDSSYRWHLDTEALGRMNNVGYRRCHIVDCMADMSHPWLRNVAAHSRIVQRGDTPLVTRFVRAASGMGRIASDPEAQRQSADEHQRLLATYGVIPW